MSDVPQGPGWWQASDGKWYAPEQAPGGQPPAAGPPAGFTPQSAPGAAPGFGAPAYGGPASPAGTPGGATVSEAFNYGWLKFQQNVGPILIAMLAMGVVAFIVFFFLQIVLIGALSSSDSGFAFFMLGAAYSLVAFTLLFLIQMAVIRAGLILTEGRQLELKEMFATELIAPYVIASLILGVGTAIGSLLCYVPGLIIAFFGQFFGYFVLDRKEAPMDSLKSSFSFVNANLGTLVVFYLASLVAYFIGAILCGLGLLVAVPVVVIAQAFLYRRLTGQAVAP